MEPADSISPHKTNASLQDIIHYNTPILTPARLAEPSVTTYRPSIPSNSNRKPQGRERKTGKESTSHQNCYRESAAAAAFLGPAAAGPRPTPEGAAAFSRETCESRPAGRREEGEVERGAEWRRKQRVGVDWIAAGGKRGLRGGGIFERTDSDPGPRNHPVNIRSK
jgi:hypothetical protein